MSNCGCAGRPQLVHCACHRIKLLLRSSRGCAPACTRALRAATTCLTQLPGSLRLPGASVGGAVRCLAAEQAAEADRREAAAQVSPPAANFQVNASALSASLATATSSGDPTAVMSAVRSLAASTAAAAPPPLVAAGVTTLATVDVRAPGRA